MRKLAQSILVAFIIFLFGCSASLKKGDLFYPVDSLLDAQVKVLSTSQATLAKSASIGQQSSDARYVPKDSSAWRKELEVFYHISTINKPVNQNLYDVQDRLDDDGAKRIKVFTARENLPVEYLELYTSAASGTLLTVRARLRENNSMYDGTQDLELQFSEKEGQALLTKYHVKGGQKMFMADSVQYRIDGSISIVE